MARPTQGNPYAPDLREPRRAPIFPLVLAALVPLAFTGCLDVPEREDYFCGPEHTARPGPGAYRCDSDASQWSAIVPDTGEVPFGLYIECGDVPLGAVGAPYELSLDFGGGSGMYVTEASDLPPGLEINEDLVFGTPTEAGTFTIGVSVTDVGERMASATCDITIADQMHVELPAGRTCLAPGDDVRELVVGGNGGPISCSLTTGCGSGSVPDGLTVNRITCEVDESGVSATTHQGTYAFLVDVTQSGRAVTVPFCYTSGANHPIAVTWDGETTPLAEPRHVTYDTESPFSLEDANGDLPRFEYTPDCGGGSCGGWSASFSAGCSPMDSVFSFDPTGSVEAMDGTPIGLFHHLSRDTGGESVASKGFEGTWIFDARMIYCTATVSGDCSDLSAVNDGAFIWPLIATAGP